ncbi:MAG: ABC transporter substrate-binding protein, partial [Acidobacteriota bacterium]
MNEKKSVSSRRTTYRQLMTGAALASVVVGICGCGGASGRPKDTLVFASSADATTLDPHNTTDSQSDQVVWMVYNALLRFDEEMNIVGDLAEDWVVADDGTTWTFRLRQGVRFHDGTPFDAEAVKRNFERVLNPEENHKRRALFSALDRVEVMDAYTVRIVTKYPFGAFEPTMAHVSATIVNPTVAEKYGKQFGLSAEATSGTGPYKVVRWKKDLEIVLERNDDYWGNPGKLRRVIYRPIPEAASRVIALEAGDVDVITHIPAADVPRLKRDSSVVITKTVSIGAQQFRFHCKRRPFADPRVRQAISYAIDRRTIIENLVPGLAIPSTGPLTAIMRGRAHLGEIAYDPEKAKQLLAEAGYPDGFKTTITTTPRYNMGVELAEAVAAQLKKVGIEADIEVLEWGTIRQYWGGLTPEDCPFEIFIMGAGASSADADWGLRPIFMTQPTNENNYGFYSNAEFDDLVIRAMREMDADKRNALYRRAQEIVYLEDPGAIWMYDLYHVFGARKTVADITSSPLGLVTFEKAH